MADKTKPVSKGVAAFWMVVLFLVAAGIFWGLDNPPWYVQGIGYLSGFLAFGALLELFKSTSRTATANQSVESVHTSSDEDDLLGRYGELLDARSGFISRESELPAPKSQLRAVLLKAREDPFYKRYGAKAVDSCLTMLDTFVPDDEYEVTEKFVGRAIELAGSGDEAAYSSFVSEATEEQRRALSAVVNVVLQSKQ